MTRDAQVVSNGSRRPWIPWAILAISLALTLVATWYVQSSSAAAARERFHHSAESLREDISDRLATYMTMLRGGAGLVAAEPNLTYDEFRRYVERLETQKYYPGIQGIGLSLHVSPEQHTTIVDRMRRQGITTTRSGNVEPFDIWPATTQPSRHTIVYLGPLDRRNHAAIGYDMFSEATRREAMERARDNGEPVATAKVQLVQEIDEAKQPGFLIYVPVYQGGIVPGNVELRREQFLGFVYSPFRINDLLKGIYSAGGESPLWLTIYDGTEIRPGELMYSSPAANPAHHSMFQERQQILIAGRPWTLLLRSSPEFEEESGTVLLPMIPIGGALVSFTLFILSRLQWRARYEAELTALQLSDSEQALRRSESRLRRLVESNIIGVAFGTLDGRVYDANDAYFRITGRDRGSIAAGDLRWNQLDASGSTEAQTRAVTQLRQTGVCHPFEEVFIRPDGTASPVLVGVAMLEGGREECVAILLDLTEQKRVEQERAKLLEMEQAAREAAEQAQRQLAFLADASDVLSGSLEYESTLKSVARLAVPYLCDWCLIYAVGRGGQMRRVAVECNDPRDRAIADGLMRQPLELSDPQSVLTAVLVRGESMLVDNLSESALAGTKISQTYRELVQAADLRSGILTPLRAHGQVIGGIALARKRENPRYSQADIPLVEELARRASVAIENARLYQSAQEARAEAERASRLKDEFLATVSHELRTPLNAILGWAQLLRDERDDQATLGQGLETIARNAQAQAQLVNDLLDVSRIISGKMRLEVQRADMRQIVQSAVASLRPAADARQLRVTVRVDQPAILLGDPDRLQQVAWNLLSNAIKFTPRGGEVELRLETGEELIRFTVSDTGQGISADFLPHMFSPFRQADASTTRTHGGLGLGLSIVRHLVELHGGTIRAESPGLGRGSTFTVELPVYQGERRQQAERAATVPSADPPAPAPLPRLHGMRILVVDDEDDTRELLARVFHSAAAEVHLCASAEQALDIIETFKPNLLGSDLSMPHRDGFWLIRQIRKVPDGQARFRSIAVSALARPEDARRALAEGYNLHVPKPVTPAELLSAVDAVLARSNGS